MFYVGLDLGQRQDFSALAVVEREEQRFTLVTRASAIERETPGADGIGNSLPAGGEEGLRSDAAS